MTAAVMQAQLFDDADAPWNSLMAAATIYSLPPVAIFFALRRTMTAALDEAGPLSAFRSPVIAALGEGGRACARSR